MRSDAIGSLYRDRSASLNSRILTCSLKLWNRFILFHSSSSTVIRTVPKESHHQLRGREIVPREQQKSFRNGPWHGQSCRRKNSVMGSPTNCMPSETIWFEKRSGSGFNRKFVHCPIASVDQRNYMVTAQRHPRKEDTWTGRSLPQARSSVPACPW